MDKTSWLERHITLQNYDDPKAERENAFTHLIGTILSVAACIVILVKNGQVASTSLRIGMVVWGLTMILLYGASSLYHYLPRGDAKRFCRILDHSNIYFLIAGTYTPMMCYIDTEVSMILLTAVWVIAALGVVFTLVFWGRLKPLHVALYVAMGWLLVFFWGDIVPHLPSGLLAWILAAGITYTAGVIFYANKKIPHYHAIWHLFCIAGSALFFFGYVTKLY